MGEETSTVDAILMASGFSRRFGPSNKLLAPFLGKPLVLHSLELLCSCGLFNHVYLAAADPDVLRLANLYPVIPLVNHSPQSGQRESVRLGALASHADHLLFVQADQPLLDIDTLLLIVGARKPNAIVQPTYNGQRGSPVLFSSLFKEELATLTSGQQARAVIQRHAGALVPVPLPCLAPLLDVDLPEDIRKLEALAGR